MEYSCSTCSFQCRDTKLVVVVNSVVILLQVVLVVMTVVEIDVEAKVLPVVL